MMAGLNSWRLAGSARNKVDSKLNMIREVHLLCGCTSKEAIIRWCRDSLSMSYRLMEQTSSAESVIEMALSYRWRQKLSMTNLLELIEHHVDLPMSSLNSARPS